MKFRTESGSTYEVDATNKKVRRLAGSNPATGRQGKDGDWRAFVSTTPIEVGFEAFFVWEDTTKLLPATLVLLAEGIIAGAIPGTITSRVVEILEQ